RGVKDLFINKWNHGENLSGFSGMEQLRSLRLYSPTRLVSLSGIEPLTNLTCIEIALARKLESISGVEGLSRLRVLGLHTCKKIRSGPGKRSQLAGYDLPVPVRQAT
ncbi:MAG: hypothetical protein KDB61_05825, partial [Planctomycetes bacterium]|nr:hypothetical protein [Planctomycetota bacterium]